MDNNESKLMDNNESKLMDNNDIKTNTIDNSSSSSIISTTTLEPLIPSNELKELSSINNNLVQDADKVITNLKNWNNGRRNSKLSSSTISSSSSINEYNEGYKDTGDLLFLTSQNNLYYAENTIKRYQQTTNTLRSMETILGTDNNTNTNVNKHYDNTLLSSSSLTNSSSTVTLQQIDGNINQLQNDTLNLTAKMLMQAKLAELGISENDINDALQ